MDLENLVQEAIDGEAFKFSSQLNEKFWDENEQMKPELRDKLLQVVIEYIKFLKLPEGVKVKDVTATGSLAGYNYSKYSDLDIHIIIDYDQISTNHDFVTEYMRNKRTIWAESNDITVYGYPLEMYAQDVNEYLEGPSPQYSLIKKDWLRKMDNEKPEIDKATVIKKAKELAQCIDKLSHNHDYEDVIEKSNALSKKIKNIRTDGLKGDGEFSTENLIFKTLRNGGYLEKLRKIKEKAVSKEFSLK
jgi:hypothetical protein